MYECRAGDSSLDNKFWLSNSSCRDGVHGYEQYLQPNRVKPDVAYHINQQLLKHNKSDYICINAAVEESALIDRTNDLLPQDRFIRNHITENDMLVVSLGGNDIALKPSISTIFNMLLLTNFNYTTTIENSPGNAWGMSYFTHMFSTGVQSYIEKLLKDRPKPGKIVVCMIYYPDEKETGSWADRTLGIHIITCILCILYYSVINIYVILIYYPLLMRANVYRYVRLLQRPQETSSCYSLYVS